MREDKNISQKYYVSEITGLNLPNVYSAIQEQTFTERIYSPSFPYLSFLGLEKGGINAANSLFRSHSVEARKLAKATCQHSPVSTPRHRVWPWQSSIFAATRSLELLHFPYPPLENPTSWCTPQKYNLSASLCQDDLAQLRHIDWNSVETFESIFLKERKPPRHNWKKRTYTQKNLKFYSMIWVCARLEGTTCKFFFRSCQNTCLKFALTQLSAGKTCCRSWCINKLFLVQDKS